MENKNSGWKRVGREMKIDMPFIFRDLSEDLLFVGLTRVHGSLLALKSRPSYMHFGICVPVAQPTKLGLF